MPTKKLKKNKENIRRKAQIKLIETLIKANEKYIKDWKDANGKIKKWKALNPITMQMETINDEEIKYNLIYAKQETEQLKIIKEKIEKQLEFL